jgi:hypothetical protein
MRPAAIALLGLVFAAVPASAGSQVAARASAGDAVHVPFIGLMTDVGVPDGATASIVIRPVRALRVELGVGHDGVGPGVRGGLTWIPLRSWATPVLGVGYGRFFERDANPIYRLVTGDAMFSSPLLDRVGYDFATARAGIELGREHVTFFVHAGITRVTAALHDVALASNAAAAQGGSMVTVSSTDPSVQLWTVSANVGLVFYLH